MTRMLHIYRPRRFKRTWFGVNRPSCCWVPVLEVSRSPYLAYGHAHYAAMGKWPWRCTSTGQEGSNELDLEWIGPVFAEFRHLHDSRSPYYQWACQCGPHGQITMTLHIYRTRWFQWTGFRVNRPSGYWFMACAKFGPDERTDGWTNGWRAFHSPPISFGKEGGQTLTFCNYKRFKRNMPYLNDYMKDNLHN